MYKEIEMYTHKHIYIYIYIYASRGLRGSVSTGLRDSSRAGVSQAQIRRTEG